MSIIWDIDTDDVDDELARLENMPDARDIAVLDGVLLSTFSVTQTIVHVVTGSLKASGNPEAEYDHIGKRWEGSITYGGPSPGSVHDPVNYAFYEQRRRGSHDFMSPTELADPAFRIAMEIIVSGRS